MRLHFLPLLAAVAPALGKDIPPRNPQSLMGMGMRASVGLPPIKAATQPPYGLYETSSSALTAFLTTNADDIAIVDLRPNSDYNVGHITNALRFPMLDEDSEQKFIADSMKKGQLPPFFTKNPEVWRKKKVLFYCNQGVNRSPAIAAAYYSMKRDILSGEITTNPMVNIKNINAEQEVLLLGGGLEEYKKSEGNWEFIEPRPKKVVKPVPVPNAVQHGGKPGAGKASAANGDKGVEIKNPLTPGAPGGDGDGEPVAEDLDESEITASAGSDMKRRRVAVAFKA